MKTKILKTLCLAAIIICGIGCTKETGLTESRSQENVTLDAETAKSEFAKILSKAVLDNEELRSFLKKEALKQFDKDYDVFYPYIKNAEVTQGTTFREYLLSYTEETVLQQIETSLPLLNILVPDWSWIGAFSVNSWDISDTDIVVGLNNHVIYYNGEKLCELEAGLFPEFPVLIVKDNERMKCIEPVSKADNRVYTFADDAYNPIATKVDVETSYIYPATTPGSNFVNAANFKTKCPEAVAAWEEYGTNIYDAQRSYIYFNLKKGETTGKLNPKIRESIMAIRLNNTNCMDDKTDPVIGNATKKSSDYTTTEAIIDAVWSDGQLEIQLYATAIDENNQVKVLNENVIPVNGKDLFDIKSIQRDFYHKTWFSKRKYVYITKTANLLPKWYYLPTPLTFKQWDPSKESTIINIHAYEIDGETDIEVTETIKTQKGINISGKVGNYVELNLNFNSKVNETLMKYTIHKGSDDLGTKELYFDDYVIRSERDGKYELQYYSTAQLDFIVVPLK